jgi:hypothetical protein
MQNVIIYITTKLLLLWSILNPDIGADADEEFLKDCEWVRG